MYMEMLCSECVIAGQLRTLFFSHTHHQLSQLQS